MILLINRLKRIHFLNNTNMKDKEQAFPPCIHSRMGELEKLLSNCNMILSFRRNLTIGAVRSLNAR